MHDSRRRLLFAAAAAGLALIGAGARPAAGEEQPVVIEILIRGVPGDGSAIRDLMQTREGARLDLTRLDDDLKALFRAGHLATYQRQTVPGGVRLIIEITEALRLRRIAIKGVGREWERKLKEDKEQGIILRAGDPLSAAILKVPEAERFRGDKERIRAYCHERGYRAVTVVSETVPAPTNSNRVDVTFTVDLGPKYQVTSLRFAGNRSIHDGELKSQMKTKRDTLFTSRRYCDAVFEDDIVRVQDYYRFKGFPNAKVSYRRRFLGRKGNRVDITIVVEEGQQFPVETVTVEGNKALSSDTLLASIPLKPAVTYSDEKLLESRQAIERLYAESGHPYATITPTRQVNPTGEAFDVTFTVDEGERVIVNTIRTRGHPRTRRDVILREMELAPGMEYDVRKLDRSQRALERLQFFDSVVMKLEPADPPAAGERDLLVEVTEGRTGLFNFGIGFSTTDALVGKIELAQRNFDWRDRPKDWDDLWSGNAYVGAGQQFRVTLMPGTVYSNYAIAYDNPYWKGGNESFGWSVYYRSRDQGEWDETRTGVRVYRGIRKYKGDPDTDLVFHTRFEIVGVTVQDDDDDPAWEWDEGAPQDAMDEEGTHPVLGAGVTLRRDRTDRPVFPSTGYLWELGSELVVPHGVTLGAGGTRFWAIGDRPKGYEHVFSLRGRIDYELGSFPIYERLYAGGADLRGFAYRGAGPHQNEEPVGGKYRALVSAEYRYPIAPPNFYGVVFCDTGTVTEEFSLYGAPRLSLGLGFRLLIPALSNVPISLDFAAPIIKQGDDDTEFFYFSVSLSR